MTSLVTVKKEVKELKSLVLPKKPHEASGLFPCDNGGPHGYCKIRIDGSNIRFESATFEEELQGLQNFYECVVHPKPHIRKKFPTL